MKYALIVGIMATLIHHSALASVTVFRLTLGTSTVQTMLKLYPTATFANVDRYTHGPNYRLPIDTLHPPTILVNDGLAEISLVFDRADRLVALLCVMTDQGQFGRLAEQLGRHYSAEPHLPSHVTPPAKAFRSGETRILLLTAPKRHQVFLSFVEEAFFDAVKRHQSHQRAWLVRP
ncbi:hypothetical protein [Vibrio europaeus]|uniref:hypothetical protein n=1 Tax=Vibrio europaeus TaxID=300876 RepID=UPI0039DFE6C7